MLFLLFLIFSMMIYNIPEVRLSVNYNQYLIKFNSTKVINNSNNDMYKVIFFFLFSKINLLIYLTFFSRCMKQVTT